MAATSTSLRSVVPTPENRDRLVIVLDNRFDSTASVTVCPLTTNLVSALLVRIPVDPTDTAGIGKPCQIMVDKVTTMPKVHVRDHLGHLADANLVRLDRALVVFLGLADCDRQPSRGFRMQIRKVSRGCTRRTTSRSITGHDSSGDKSSRSSDNGIYCQRRWSLWRQGTLS